MRIALSFLTRLPVGRVASEDYMRDLGRSAGLFPLVGLLVGLIALGTYLVSRLFFGPAPAAVATMVAGIWASGMLHLDGLMDTADGVLSSRSLERMLAIMKDSRSGAMGVAVGALALLFRFSLLLDLPRGMLPAALLAAPALGRMIMPLAAVGWPPARGEEGLGSSFARYVGRGRVAVALLSGLLLAIALPAAVGGLGQSWRGLAAWLAAVGVCLGGGRWLANRLGGLTGDTYGALSELAELAALACFAVQPGGWTY